MLVLLWHGNVPQSFIPGLSTLTAPLHELLKKDTKFNWDASFQAAFQHFKDAVVSETTLW